MDQNEWHKEHKKVVSEEKRFLNSRMKEKTSLVNQAMENIVPNGLQENLNKAFVKGFDVVFSKGIPVVEKTYNKMRREEEFRINEFAMETKQKKSMKGFKQSAARSARKNVLISGAEGAAFGVLGVGLPDIPIFIGMVLKAIQEIAISYGFDYNSEREKVLILKVIRTAILYGEDLIAENRNIGKMICDMDEEEIALETEIIKTAGRLSDRLLYMKFVQGIPLIGVIGGISDFTIMKEISKYANLVYKKRFLRKIWIDQMRG